MRARRSRRDCAPSILEVFTGGCPHRVRDVRARRARRVDDSPDARARGAARAERTFGDLGEGVVRELPTLTIIFVLLVSAGLLVRIARAIIQRTLGDWPRANAATAITGVSIWVATAALSITSLAGDESWTNVTIRHLVDARKRRKWKTELVLRVCDELRRRRAPRRDHRLRSAQAALPRRDSERRYTRTLRRRRVRTHVFSYDDDASRRAALLGRSPDGHRRRGR